MMKELHNAFGFYEELTFRKHMRIDKKDYECIKYA